MVPCMYVFPLDQSCLVFHFDFCGAVSGCVGRQIMVQYTGFSKDYWTTAATLPIATVHAVARAIGGNDTVHNLFLNGWNSCQISTLFY